MESHSLDTECPEFKFEVVRQYSDPLRRQLSEALHILEVGSLNRKMEFNENMLCRLESKQTDWEADKKYNADVRERHIFNERLENFIAVMSSVSKHCDRKNNNLCDIPSNETEFDCYRLNSLAPQKRKRDMESSTPVNWRKQKKFMEDSESPIDQHKEAQQDTSSCSEEKVNMSLNPTGISDELQSRHLTPTKSETSSVVNGQLFTTAQNWTAAAVGCGFIKRSSSMPNLIVDIDDNYFSKKSHEMPKAIVRRTYSASELMKNLKMKIMVALMLKLAILVMMESTCYTFGGKIYRQVHSARGRNWPPWKCLPCKTCDGLDR